MASNGEQLHKMECRAMKYLHYVEAGSYQPEGENKYIPHDTGNADYVRMMEEVEAGISTIEEVEV
tara:strand:- start:145 stop:339 length:195 start_codon:yes stop_codon:yes gene_type:complete